jgi:predicted dehydrogenase
MPPSSCWVVGAGYWGQILSTKIRAVFPDASVTLIDTNESVVEHLKTMNPNMNFSTLDRALNQAKSSDLFFVVTPPPTHYQIVKIIIEQGFNVWCEKPLTMSSAHALELVELAHKNEVTLFVDNTFLFDPAIKKMKSIVENLEEPLYISSNREALGKILPGIGVIWDLVPHDLSIMSYVLNQVPTFITATTQSVVADSFQVYVKSRILLESYNGVSIDLSLSCISPVKRRNIDIMHSEGIISYNLGDTGSELQTRNWNQIPGNHSNQIQSPPPKFTSSEDNLANGLNEFNLLVCQRKQHQSLGFTVREIELIETIHKAIL